MSRTRLLLLMFLVLALALFYAWQETPRQQRTQNRLANEHGSVDEGTQNGQRPKGGLDFSGGEKLSYNIPKRDLFRLFQGQPKPVEKVIVKPIPRPEPVKIEVPPVPPPPITSPPVLPKSTVKPIPQLKVLGSLTKENTQIVFLSSVAGEIYVVKRGDRFADGLLVREFTADEVVISRGLSDTGVTLPLIVE